MKSNKPKESKSEMPEFLPLKELGVDEEDVKRVRDRLHNTKPGKACTFEAKQILVGTFAAKDRDTIAKIAKQPAKLQVVVADLIVNKKITVDKAIEIAEEIERASKGWPVEYDAIFGSTRNELVTALQVVAKARTTVNRIFKRIHEKNKGKKVKQVKELQERINLSFQSMYNRVETNSPLGLCPNCVGENCQWCLGDGWLTIKTSNYLSSEGNDITTYT